jgi:hypothetical protein
VWIDERHPTYRLDHSAGRVYVLATEREIRAMKF